jgi:hypothetical protein
MKIDGVSWKLNGLFPETDSIPQALQHGLLIIKMNWLRIEPSQRYRLPEMLPETDAPRIGRSGFFIFGLCHVLFQRQNGHPFCNRYDTEGIAALEINFGPKLIRYDRVNY